MSIKLVKYFLLSLCLGFVFLAQAENLKQIIVKTSDCDNCGMTSLGGLSAKICGKNDPNLLGGLCCLSVDLDNSDNNFQQGGIDIFETAASLGECYNFNLGYLPGSFDDVHMTLYHTGSDGGNFEYVQVSTTSGKLYQCPFGQFMDGSSYVPSDSCFRVS